MPVYYARVEIFVSGSPAFILFRQAPVPEAETKELRLLRERIERAAEVVGALYALDDTARAERLAYLHGIASNLVGDIAATRVKNVADTQNRQLDALEQMLVRYAASFHSGSYDRLRLWTIAICVVSGLIGIAVNVFDPWIAHQLEQHKDTIKADGAAAIIGGFSFVVCGASAGLWLNAHIRFTGLDMTKVLNFDPNYLKLGARLQATFFLAMATAVLFYSGALKIEVLKFQLGDFAAPGNWGIAFVLGFLVALGETGLTKRIMALVRRAFGK